MRKADTDAIMDPMQDERAAVRRWLTGMRASAVAQQALQSAEGPRPGRAVLQSLSALSALSAMGRWPGPRDAVSERAVDEVRARWVRIQNACPRREVLKIP